MQEKLKGEITGIFIMQVFSAATIALCIALAVCR